MAITNELPKMPETKYVPTRYFCHIWHPKEWHLNWAYFKQGKLYNCQLCLGYLTFEFAI